MTGVFISRGMQIVIRPGDLKVTADGKNNTLTPHVHFDVCPMWFELSLDHLLRARDARAARDQAWAGSDEAAKAAALEREFESSMQAITSAAIAVDAFYAVVQSKVPIAQDVREAWIKNRTARPARILETIRQGFTLKQSDAQMLKGHFHEIFRFRDMAVHPSGKLDQPLLHSELNVGVEWRFETFRFTNARMIVHAALSAVWQLSEFVKLDEDLQRYVTGLHQLLSPVVGSWPAEFDPILGARRASDPETKGES